MVSAPVSSKHTALRWHEPQCSGLVWFFVFPLFVFLLSFLLSPSLLPTSLSSLLKFSAVRCLSLPFRLCCQARFQGLSCWPSAHGSADGHRPRLSSCPRVFSLDSVTSEGCESSFCGTDVSGLVGAGRACLTQNGDDRMVVPVHPHTGEIKPTKFVHTDMCMLSGVPSKGILIDPLGRARTGWQRAT